MADSIKFAEVRETAVNCLLGELGENLLGLALFGSVARGEGSERSDLDFFVVTRGVKGDREQRRRRVYHILAPVNRRFRRDVSVYTLEESEVTDVTPLLINIAHDAVILFDPEGYLEKLFARVREAVRRAGLVPYRTRDGKIGWKPVRELEWGERIEVKF
ncbi:MAG: nucleotidyltransferase domain-containing protein [Candidatus Freyarchaeota archaeon]|nr:nucleotidyltransferase domain-containing protein [Candidatus Jordarchaeia archaeon]MBS7268925.1 nucleotidyltransferase domain-containing protein [Candidatus Jordarchaeia archaeon]MBS7281633.1 nucleotidyltransferase domain-containing protein [Candidatus Jordarchaeia archaeon]